MVPDLLQVRSAPGPEEQKLLLGRARAAGQARAEVPSVELIPPVLFLETLSATVVSRDPYQWLGNCRKSPIAIGNDPALSYLNAQRGEVTRYPFEFWSDLTRPDVTR
jgi:hypothetical protein